MARVRRINVSQIEGDNANNTTSDEIRPYGEIALYQGDNNRLELLIADGIRTNLKNKVLSKGTFYGGDADSGDGAGFDTIKLVPDETLRRNGSDQFLIVDPTAPNHVHLRAGGTQDNSTAQLFIGGETSHFMVGAGLNPNVYVTSNSNSWTFGYGGSMLLPGGASITNLAYDLNLFSGNDGVSTYGDVNIITNNPFATSVWSFGTAGDLALPAGGYLNNNSNSSGDGNGYSTLSLIPDGTLEGSDQYIILDPTAPGHIHIRAGGTQDNSNATLILGGENSYFSVSSGPNPSVSVAANGNSWIFGQQAIFSMPAIPAATLTSIGANVGSLAIVSDSTPAGKLAFWDGTNNRWSYVNDNSAV